MPRWRWIISQLLRKIWFRAAFIAVFSVALALAAIWLAPLIPYQFSLQIGTGAVDNILTVLASSMLAVTTFSMTAMVTAFSGASQHGTPRATELLIEDAAAQNALSTFLGAFLFSIVGIIALQTGLYGDQGRAILLLGTIGVIVWISVVLLRWIGQLSHFGRVADTIERVERKGREAVEAYEGPFLLASSDKRRAPDGAAVVVCPERAGYVAHVDRAKLSTLAKEKDIKIHIVAPAGTFMSRERPLAWVEGLPENPDRSHEQQIEDISAQIAEQFVVARHRDFDQDPRFGAIVLAEIGSRALSPGINDPGTAIAALSAGLRLFDDFLDRDPLDYEQLEGVDEPSISFEQMVHDLVDPIARDGAGTVEVGIRLQRILGAMAERVEDARDILFHIAKDARDRALAELKTERERDAIRSAFGDGFS